jgi:hypothetical protein
MSRGARHGFRERANSNFWVWRRVRTREQVPIMDLVRSYDLAAIDADGYVRIIGYKNEWPGQA